MSASIDQAFIKQFETEVKLAYQRKGSKLRNTVRTKNNVTGKSTTFQKVGAGTAGTKSRHGLVPLMNLDHTNVECTLEDTYAADYIDKLDELKINIDERGVVAESGAAAVGRKTDDLIIAAMSADTTRTPIATGAAGLTQAKVETVFEDFGVGEIPDDGERYFAVDPRNWTQLLGITAFSNADYIGSDDLPYKGGMVARRWLGFMFFAVSNLANGAGGSSERRTMAYHRTAVGHAAGAELSTEINYVPERVAHLNTSMMSQGAVVIDGLGVYNVDALI